MNEKCLYSGSIDTLKVNEVREVENINSIIKPQHYSFNGYFTINSLLLDPIIQLILHTKERE